MSKFRQLNRESNPPSGMMASPTPQYWDRIKEEPGDVEGEHGAPFAKLLGPNGEPISQDNPLETRVRELERLIGAIAADPAANTVMARLKAVADSLGKAVAAPDEHTLLARIKLLEDELTSIKKTLTDGTAKMQLSGTDMELAVTSWDDLPGDAPLGATAQLIGTYDVRQFDGAQWVEVRL